MPSSLERVISRTLVYSTNLPVAVYGTDGYLSRERSFSRQCGINIFGSVDPPVQRLTLTTERIFLSCLATRSDKHFQSLACISSCVPPLLVTINNRFRNINLMSIGYAVRPDLRTNPTRTSLPWETLGFRCIGFSPMFSLLMPTFSLLLRPLVLPV